MASSSFNMGFGPAGDKRFNDPFLLNSNFYIPKDWYTALDFALYLAIKNPLYTQAAKRTVSHFITDFEFVGDSGDQKERDNLKEYLKNNLQLLDALQQAGLEQIIYGNAFMYIYFPFNRFLIDRRNGRYREIAVETFGRDVKFNLDKMTYNVPDPLTLHLPESQRSRIDLEFIDRKVMDPDRIKVRLLSPQRMHINMNFISGKCEYVYRFEEFFVSAVRAGQPIHQINDTPLDMLKAIKNNQNFAFKDGVIFHFKSPFINGLSYNGWGIPNILLNYNNIHQVQVLKCINEAVGLDYMLPFRLLCPTPVSSQNGNDAAMSMHLGKFMQSMSSLIANKRKDPAALHVVPFSVSYQELGSNGKALAPVDLIKATNDEVLDGFGFPAELWHMSLQTQQVPTAIRLFESTFTHIPRNANNCVRWVLKNILSYLEKDQIGIRLQPPSVADDMEKRHVWLQLASGGEVSRATAYKAFNIDNPIEEQRRRAQEDIEIQKVKQKENEAFEREMTLGSANQVVDAMLQSQGGAGGGMPPSGGGGGGAAPPPGGGGDSGLTPLDIEEQAEQQAQQLLQIQDVGERRKMMMQIKSSNPTLYAVVQRHMEDARQAGASQGRKSVGQGG